MHRPTFDQIYMQMAVLFAERSTCDRAKVGCVIVSDDNQRVLSVGYNGGPKGLADDCLSSEPGKCGHLHAELNCLLKCNYNDPAPKKMYVTMECCYNCSVAVVNSNIHEVIYLNEYRTHEGLDLLKQAGVKVRRFLPENLLYPPKEK